MKQIAKLTIVFIALLALCVGCVHAPKTRLAGKVLDQPFSLSTASDLDLEGLTITAERATNGAAKVSITVGKASRKMNPDVLTAQGQAQAAALAGTAQVLSTIPPLVQELRNAAKEAAAASASGGATLLVPTNK